ncbi:putative HXT5-hexose transporter [Atractiella rhizophila]|nr:putative HXT5-hexose transporter [Atractiella rhizophila]
MGRIAMNVRGASIGLEAILVGLLASVGGFIFGYDTGQISGFLAMDDFLLRFGNCTNRADASTCHIPTAKEGLIVGLLSIGCGIGALIGADLADRLGRTRAMSVECLVFTIGVVIQITSFYAWYQVMIGRFVAGLAVGALSAAIPVYQSETAPKQIRGSLVATYQLMITIGILVSNAFGVGTSTLGNSGEWRIVMALGLVFSTFLGVGILFVPESPRWLLHRSREEEAYRAVCRLRGVSTEADDPLAQSDFQEMVASVREEKTIEPATWLDAFRWENKTLYRTLLGATLQCLQQLTGANYFFYYGTQIFNGVGISNPFVVQLILGAVNVVTTFLGIWQLERFGRRWPLIIGALWQSAWLFVFAASGTAKDPTENKGIANLMIVAACLFITGFASTWGPGIWIVIGETFSFRTRTKQGAIATASNWLWNFMLAFFTPFITGDIGYAYGFVFAGCNFASALVVYFFLYESSGLSLEAVDHMYNDPNVKPWSSSKWAPPGYKNRYQFAEALESGKEAPMEKESKSSSSGVGTSHGEKTEEA